MSWFLMSGKSSSRSSWVRLAAQAAIGGAARVGIDSPDRGLLFALGSWWLRLAYRNRPVPVSRLLFIRNFATCQDALFPELQAIMGAGEGLRNPLLASTLADMELGVWSLTPSTLNFLEQQIQILKPKLVLEFGSGVSTACVARYMKDLHGDPNRVYAISIEQELSFIERTSELLEALQLGNNVRIVHSPLRQQTIEDVRTTCYDLSGDSVRAVLMDIRPDFVVIDGPAAEPGARFGTLPLIRSFLSPGAWFFLDDALRDAELKVAQLWSQLPAVRINGVYLSGKGLLVGQVGGGD